MISLCRTCEAAGVCTTYGEPDLICDDGETDQCNSSFCGCIESPTLEPTATYCSSWCPGQFEWDANPRQDNNVYACTFWICAGIVKD